MIYSNRSTYKYLSDDNCPIWEGREVNWLFSNHLYMDVNKLYYFIIDQHTIFEVILIVQFDKVEKSIDCYSNPFIVMWTNYHIC